MSNRTLFFLTALVICAMIALLAINMTSILTGQPPNQQYFKYNDVRGMAISHNQLLYTLNFKEQNSVIDIINRAVPIHEIKEGKREPSNIEKLIVYRFENKPDIALTPIGSVDGNLVFSAPQLESDGFLMELSDGDLRKMLSQLYD